MKNKITFILAKLLFGFSLAEEFIKIKDFPRINLIGEDRYVGRISEFLSGNNKYKITPEKSGVSIRPFVNKLGHEISHSAVALGCKDSLMVGIGHFMLLCENKKIVKAKVMMDEVTGIPSFTSYGATIDLQSILQASSGLGAKGLGQGEDYNCRQMERWMFQVKTVIVGCYKTQANNDSLVIAFVNTESGTLLKKYEFPNKAPSKTSAHFEFTVETISKFQKFMLVVKEKYSPNPSGFLKTYILSKEQVPTISGEKIFNLTQLSSTLGSQFVMTYFKIFSRDNDLLFLGGYSGKNISIFSFNYKEGDDASKLVANSSVTLNFTSEYYGPLFGSEIVIEQDGLLRIFAKNFYKFFKIFTNKFEVLPEGQIQANKADEINEYFYACAESSKDNEMYVRHSVNDGVGYIVGFYKSDSFEQSRGLAIVYYKHSEVQCLEPRADFIIRAGVVKRESYFKDRSQSKDYLVTSKDNSYQLWSHQAGSSFTLDVNAVGLPDGESLYKLRVERQKRGTGIAPIDIDLKIGKYKDLASTPTIISTPAQSVMVYPGERIDIPVGIENLYGNNLDLSVHADEANSVNVRFRNKIVVTFPSLPSLGSNKHIWDRLRPIGNDYFVIEKKRNPSEYQVFVIYKCDLVNLVQQVECKKIKDFQLDPSKKIFKMFVVKKTLLVVLQSLNSRNSIVLYTKVELPEVSMASMGTMFSIIGDINNVEVEELNNGNVVVCLTYTKIEATREVSYHSCLTFKLIPDVGSLQLLPNVMTKYPYYKQSSSITHTFDSTEVYPMRSANKVVVSFVKETAFSDGITILRRVIYNYGRWVSDGDLGPGRNKVICTSDRYLAILDVAKLTLTGYQVTGIGQSSSFSFPLTLPGSHIPAKVIKSKCLPQSDFFQIMVTNYNQDRKWLINFRVSNMVNGLQRSHSRIEIPNDALSFDSISSLSGKVYTSFTQVTKSTSRDIYYFDPKGPEIEIDTKNIQKSFEVKISATGTKNSTFKIIKAQEVTKIKINTTVNITNRPSFVGNKTVVVGNWVTVDGPVIDIELNFDPKYKDLVEFSGRKEKKYRWNPEGNVSLTNIISRGELIFGTTETKLCIMRRPTQFSDKNNDDISFTTLNKVFLTNIQKLEVFKYAPNSYLGIFTIPTEVRFFSFEVAQGSTKPTNGIKIIKMFEKSSNAQDMFFIANSSDYLIYVEAIGMHGEEIRIRTFQKDSKQPATDLLKNELDLVVPLDFPSRALNFLRLNGTSVMILYANNQVGTLSALVFNKEPNPAEPGLRKYIRRFQKIQFLENGTYGLPEKLSCEIEILKETPQPQNGSEPGDSTHKMTCFVDIVGARDYRYEYLVNANANPRKNQSLITNASLISTVHNLRGFEILKASSTKKYSAVLLKNKNYQKKLANLKSQEKFETEEHLKTGEKSDIKNCPHIVAIYSQSSPHSFTILTCKELPENAKAELDISFESQPADYLYVSTIQTKNKTVLYNRYPEYNSTVELFLISKSTLAIKSKDVPLQEIKLKFIGVGIESSTISAEDVATGFQEEEKGRGIWFWIGIVIGILLLLFAFWICFGKEDHGEPIVDDAGDSRFDESLLF